MTWLQAIVAFFQLLDTILRQHFQKKREQEEQNIKENPREFFERGNPTGDDSDANRVQPTPKDE